MDPNATLQEIRDLCEQANETFIPAGLIAEKLQSLDCWISKGGFLPTDWIY